MSFLGIARNLAPHIWNDRLYRMRCTSNLLWGALLGVLTATAFRLFRYDPIFGAYLSGRWTAHTKFLVISPFSFYRTNAIWAIALLICALCLGWSTLPRRLLSSWWNGLDSSSGIFIFSLTSIGIAREYGIIYWLAGTTALGLLVFVEVHRSGMASENRAKRDELFCANLQLPDIDVERHRSLWQPTTSDNSLSGWNEDLIGRRAIVEVLVDHIFRLRTPVVAIHGNFGDGKSSVLELLRQTIEQHALVVAFNAWLPESEVALAASLFRDIVTVSRTRFHVPDLGSTARRYAGLLGGSITYFGSLKELFPELSQLERISKLNQVLDRLPQRVVVLLDEMDRMQRQEVLMLLKILRGTALSSNLTFICAFDPSELGKIIKSRGKVLSDNYLEKFFPTTILLPAPGRRELRELALRAFIDLFSDPNWHNRNPKAQDYFANHIEQVWKDGLGRLCTNLRQLKLLLSDVAAALGAIRFEADPLDLILIQVLRRFYPLLHEEIRKNGQLLTASESSDESDFISTDSRKGRLQSYLTRIADLVASGAAHEVIAARVILMWMFPVLEEIFKEEHVLVIRAGQFDLNKEARIADGEHFPIYFFAVVPSWLYSNSQFQKFLAALQTPQAEENSVDRNLLKTYFLKFRKGEQKRENFLWKLQSSIESIPPKLRVQVALLLAREAEQLAYSEGLPSEMTRSVNIVLRTAQTISKSGLVQGFLATCILEASDDTFARKLIEAIDDKERNQLLWDFSKIDRDALRHKFVKRMRSRYADPDAVNLMTGDLYAFRRWAHSSVEDRELEAGFWLEFIGSDRRKLAQAVDVLYPDGIWPEASPKDFIDEFISVDALEKLYKELPDSEGLSEREAKSLKRFGEMLRGLYRRSPFEKTEGDPKTDEDEL